jgi:hypothetical protein
MMMSTCDYGKGMIMGSAKTDNSGAFELRLLAGVTYLY